MIGITTDSITGQQQLNFANGSTSPLPVKPGFYISGSACGAGKTTIIAQIAQRYRGALFFIPTTMQTLNNIETTLPLSVPIVF